MTLPDDAHRGDILESVCYRIALISALRSKKLGGRTVGLMVTASHNPEQVSCHAIAVNAPSACNRRGLSCASFLSREVG